MSQNVKEKAVFWGGAFVLALVMMFVTAGIGRILWAMMGVGGA